MTDPAQDQPAIKEDDQLNFNWWVTMIPFLALVCWFVYRWFQNRSDMSQLLYAIGALVVGLVIGSVVASSAGAASDTAAGTTASEDKK